MATECNQNSFAFYPWGVGRSWADLTEGASLLTAGRCCCERPSEPPVCHEAESGVGEEEFEPLDQRGGEYGVDGITFQSVREAAVHPMIALQVSDFRLDRAAAPSAFSLGT
ncbi:MAG: hypothetical protein HYR83_11655 [Planctomycetes bacterium]|nr:hypothetical protein [Planctomycetota bacterium]